ncbi:tail fiber assembly protein [Rhodobacter lacus]|uniref:Tail fiber assembly protein n=1 Tax=Rhodobacter lacus TaxID=1641972 RepID=A0ABW5A842_9RHOB
MIRGLIYDGATGEVLRAITCAAADLAANLPEGAAFWEGESDGAGVWFKDGAPVALPPCPERGLSFDPALWAWVDRRSGAELAALARAKRDALLAGCDWTQAPDAPVDRAAWAAYRQALRDIPTQSGWPARIIWPARPA